MAVSSIRLEVETTGNAAAFVSQSVPATMTAGAAYAVTVSMLNQGTTTWTPGQLYRLGSQNPHDNTIWGTGRVDLLPGESVSPGATATFSFVVTAPSSPGSYNFQWRMVRDGVEWFGAWTPNIAVQVVPPDITPPTVTSFSPAAWATNVNVNANVTVIFSEAMNPTTVNGSTVELRDPLNALVPATVSYNAVSFTATLDPTASLSAGVTYTARVRGGGTDRVKDVAGNALAADVMWAFTIIHCFANVPGDRWSGEYFNNITLSGPPLVKRDDGGGPLHLDFGSSSPSAACGLPADNFSARWTRTVDFAAGTYRFTVTGDDGVRLYVGGQLKIDKWFAQGATTYTANVTLTADAYEVKLEYFESGGPGIALLSWTRVPGINCLPVP